MNKKIICLWGGPGAGKSTTAAKLFATLKEKGYNCELLREYIKDWVWEERKVQTGDQSYIAAKHLRKERQYIKNNLDFIVSDSPAALCAFYGEKFDPLEQLFPICRTLVKQHHEFCKQHRYKIEHFFLGRKKKYVAAGRFQTEIEAKTIDIELKLFLAAYPIKYIEIEGDETACDNILNYLGI